MAKGARFAYHAPGFLSEVANGGYALPCAFQNPFLGRRGAAAVRAASRDGEGQSGRRRKRPTVVLFVDETNGEVTIPLDVTVPVIRSRSADVPGFGIEDTGPGNVFWFSNDIPAVMAALRHPGYDYYVMLEYDVVIQRPIADIISWMRERSVDFLAHPIAAPNSAWPWRDTCKDYYGENDFLKYLNCFAAFSRDALFWLIRRRLYFSNLIRQGKLDHFPNAEAFVATEIARGGFTLAALAELGPVPHYDWSPSWLEDDLFLFADDAFIHPVSDKRKYISTTLAANPFTYFQDRYPLRKRVLRFPDEMLPALYEKLRGQASKEQLDALRADMIAYMSPQAKEKYGLERPSIGRNCPAWQSSVGADSHSAEEASDALNHIPNGHYSFHTTGEDNPWWMVDLGSSKQVDSMRIYNRNFAAGRAFGLQLLGSDDKENWTLYDSHRPEVPFEGLGGAPLTLKVKAKTRYLKLLLPHHECLHLDHIDIFGTENADFDDKSGVETR